VEVRVTVSLPGRSRGKLFMATQKGEGTLEHPCLRSCNAKTGCRRTLLRGSQRLIRIDCSGRHCTKGSIQRWHIVGCHGAGTMTGCSCTRDRNALGGRSAAVVVFCACPELRGLRIRTDDHLLESRWVILFPVRHHRFV
jgi:hypothetical protein